MENKNHMLRRSTYEELIARNIDKPSVIQRIKYNLIEVLAILMNGLGFTVISNYCRISRKKTVSRNVYYDYLHFIEPVLRELAENICIEKFREAVKENDMAVGFDAAWGHRRNSSNCIGIMMDLKKNQIIAFHIVHHGQEENKTLTSTTKHAKCMESIALFKIIDYTKLSMHHNLLFIHDCDLTDEKIIQDHLPDAVIKFDPNHFSKKNKKLINQFCSQYDDLKDLSEKIESYYSILIHDKNLSVDEKITKWAEVPDHFIKLEDLDPEYNKNSIELLKEKVKELSKTFELVDSKYNTNSIESFNFTRAVLANKNTAFRISWRIRSYIAIIKWNHPYWEQIIYDSFKLDIPKDLKDYQAQREKMINEKKKITKTDEFKKKRAIKRKVKNSKYKTNLKDTCIHHYCDDIIKKNRGKSINDFTGVQKAILITIRVNTSADKPYISLNKLKNKMLENYYHEDSKRNRSIIKAQITRLVNQNILFHKRSSYALAFET